MSTAKQKAKDLVNSYRMILMNEDTDCGEEILCTEIAKQCALIAVDELIEATKKYVAVREKVSYSKTGFDNVVHTQYDKFWQQVKQEIEKS
jgi:iron only hydrogenase large subunit-like protein